MAFIEQFNILEEALKKTLHKSWHVPFSQLIDEASKRDPFIRTHKTALQSINDLRNVLVHEQGHAIYAIPSDEAIHILETIVERYLKPKQLLDLCERNVRVLHPHVKLLDILSVMKRYDVSQMPVYDGSEFLGLLSGNMIAKWMAEHVEEIQKEGGATLAVAAGELLPYEGKKDRVGFLDKKTTVYEFIEMGTRNPSSSGIYIMTQNGSPHEKPMGIITHGDYPKIWKELKVDYLP